MGSDSRLARPNPPPSAFLPTWLRLGIYFVIAAVFVALAGCSAAPYFELSAGMQLSADEILETGGDQTGEDPLGAFELGLVWPGGLSTSIEHRSHWFEGRPFNSEPELFENILWLKYRWTGDRFDE